MKFVDESNIDSEHICCAIGNDKTNRERAQVKKSWLLSQFAHGLVLYYSDMCPFNAPFIQKMAEVSEKRGLPVEIRKVTNVKQAQSLPVTFGNCGIFLDGRIISRILLLDKKFNELLNRELQ